MYPAYVSKNNSNHKNGSKGKKLSALLRGIILKIMVIFII